MKKHYTDDILRIILFKTQDFPNYKIKHDYVCKEQTKTQIITHLMSEYDFRGVLKYKTTYDYLIPTITGIIILKSLEKRQSW